MLNDKQLRRHTHICYLKSKEASGHRNTHLKMMTLILTPHHKQLLGRGTDVHHASMFALKVLRGMEGTPENQHTHPVLEAAVN